MEKLGAVTPHEMYLPEKSVVRETTLPTCALAPSAVLKVAVTTGPLTLLTTVSG